MGTSEGFWTQFVTETGQDPGFRKPEVSYRAEEILVLLVGSKSQILHLSLGAAEIAVLLAIPRRGKQCLNSN